MGLQQGTANILEAIPSHLNQLQAQLRGQATLGLPTMPCLVIAHQVAIQVMT